MLFLVTSKPTSSPPLSHTTPSITHLHFSPKLYGGSFLRNVSMIPSTPSLLHVGELYEHVFLTHTYVPEQNHLITLLLTYSNERCLLCQLITRSNSVGLRVTQILSPNRKQAASRLRKSHYYKSTLSSVYAASSII